ncbi:MAG: hypothetical protein H7343_11105 [Undibacterium sp.]|nr:hypothetical protein [Opitutaceae bacterium]
MSAGTSHRKSPAGAVAIVLAGLAIGALAWLLPVNLKSVSPALLHAAGEGTPSLAAYGRDLIDSEKIGPAALLLAASHAVNDPRAPAVARALEQLTARQPALTAWGGWDPFLDPLFNLRANTARTTSTPVLTVFIPATAREKLRAYLQNSGSLGVQALLQTRELTATGRFVPAKRAGGQPLDALILLTALLYQGEHLSPPLQRELRVLAETAVLKKDLGELEPFFMDLLSLGRRFDWAQLSELLRRTEDAKTVSAYAHLARVAPDQLPLIYAAALFTDSADKVASYLIQFGKSGAEDLKLALAQGQGAVRLLLARQVPVNRKASTTLSAAGDFALAHPQFTLGVKYLGYLLGVFLILCGLDRLVVRGAAGVPESALPQMRAGVLALLFAALLIVGTGPFLLQAAPPSEYRLRLHLPVLVVATAAPELPSQPNHHMDSSTLISIGLFASLQVAMYLFCLVKIREIAGQELPPLIRLKLLENEENLFDGGLYLGIGGTATALVLQVLGVIEPNLLAAYSSNLFGITCVALVKIRHVRPIKRELIIESQSEARISS